MFWRRRPHPSHGWASEEIRPWTHHADTRAGYEAFLCEINERHRDITILDLHDDAVAARAKSDPDIHPEEGGQDALRRRDYVDLFTNALRRRSGSIRVSLAISTGDTIDFPSRYPIFCLQKTAGASTILIPDVDFANFGYYEDDLLDRPFRSKMDQVIFCGSSTGTMFTEQDVIDDKSDRLSLARRFLGHDDIVVRIGAAVQCTTERGLDLLRGKPYFEAIPWAEQLKRRYVLSIDGNGATCSRVVLTLRSQSVLLKYRSDERLYYFHGLQPMVHYVPIDGPDDLEHKLALLRSGAIDAPRIVKNANRFFEDNLRRKSVEAYLMQLLAMFQSDYFARLT